MQNQVAEIFDEQERRFRDGCTSEVLFDGRWRPDEDELLTIPLNTGVEAHACATLVIAFNTGGLPDIVAHQRTGDLAKAFEIDDLARGIAWVLVQRESGRLLASARLRTC